MLRLSPLSYGDKYTTSAELMKKPSYTSRTAFVYFVAACKNNPLIAINPECLLNVLRP